MDIETCKQDGFPTVKIKGRRECIAEYLDARIGQREVVDLEQKGKTVYLAFENGYKLPLLCWCCGSALEFDDLEAFRRDICGRRLEAMSWDMVEIEDGSELPQFRLELSKRLWERESVSIAVSLETAARMRHHAPYSPTRSAPEGQTRTRRSKRRRRKR